MTTPVVDVSARTVTHAGTSYFMRPLGEDEFTILVDGVPVGRAVYSFGAGNGVPEDPKDTKHTEEVLTIVADAWFAALPPAE